MWVCGCCAVVQEKEQRRGGAVVLLDMVMNRGCAEDGHVRVVQLQPSHTCTCLAWAATKYRTTALPTCLHVHSSTSRLAVLSALTSAVSICLLASSAPISTRGSCFAAAAAPPAPAPPALPPLAAAPPAAAPSAGALLAVLLASLLSDLLVSARSVRMLPTTACS